MGVGSELLDFALQRLRAPVHLKCLNANVCACRFYEHRGWREVERATDDEQMGEYVRYRWNGLSP